MVQCVRTHNVSGRRHLAWSGISSVDGIYMEALYTMLYDAHKDGSISRHPFGFHLIDWRMRLCQRVSASCRPSTIYCSRCTMCNIVLSALQVPAGNPKGCFRFSASFGLFFVAVLYRMQQSGRTRLIYTSSAGLRHTTRK